MKKSTPIQWLFRILFYILGLFFMAMGVAFSVNSNLGISPVNSLPYIAGQISGIAMGTWVIIIFCSYILLQIVILRREFRPINLLQIVFSTIFGYFVDFAKFLLGEAALPTYLGQLAMLGISILLVSLGVFLYIAVDLVPMPMEGLSLAIAQKTKIPFPSMKVIIDCIVVAISIGISLLFFHKLVGIREGTVIIAVVTGKLIAVLKKRLGPSIQQLCFSPDAVNEE